MTDQDKPTGAPAGSPTGAERQSLEGDDITDLLSQGIGAPPRDIDARIRALAHQAAADSVCEAQTGETRTARSGWIAWQRRLPVAAVLVVSAGVVTQLWQKPPDNDAGSVESIAEVRDLAASDMALSVESVVQQDATAMLRSRRAESAAVAASDNEAGGAASSDFDARERLSQILQTLEQGDQSGAEQQLIHWQEDFPESDVLALAADMGEPETLVTLANLVQLIGNRNQTPAEDEDEPLR